MAGSGLPKSNSGQIPPLPKAPSRSQSIQRTPSRRVLFSDNPPTPKLPSHNWDSGRENNNNNHLKMPPPQNQTRRDWDGDNLSEITTTKHHAREWDHSNDDKRERRGRRLCCAWVSLIVGCLVLVLMLLGALFLSVVRGSLPEFRIKRLNITKLEISTKNKQTFLNADIQLLFNITNQNEQYDLSYGALKVEVSSENINLGSVEVPAFNQKPKSVRELNVSTGVMKSEVDEDAVADLKSNYKERLVVIDVVFKGIISLNMEWHRMSGFPLKVLCSDVEQSVIDNGLQPECRVKMFNFW